MTDNPVAQHPASVDAYIRHGWSLVPIPPGTKGPAHKGWNKRDAALTLDQTLPPGYGIGLAHAYSGTMALDIDNWDRAAFELMLKAIDLSALYAAPDTVIIDSGRAGHGKLLYAMPFGLTLPSKRVNLDGSTVYELRCATGNGLTTQDVLPPTIHPITNQPYRWAGSGHWSRLPVIPQSLLDLWQSLLTVSHPEATEPVLHEIINWVEIESAIGAVAADCPREDWIMIGMALQYAGVQSGELEHAFLTWDKWSRTSPTKYPGEREMAQQWRSFRADKTSKVQLGTLFHIAREAGWVRPALDAKSFFSPVTVTEATPHDQIILSLKVPPPNLNFDLVPEVLRTRATEIGEQVGCDPLVPFFAGLSAVCGALDARIRLEVTHGFKVPPILWIMSIGEPGDMKTPGSKPMFEVLQQIEREDGPRFARAAVQYEVDEVRYTAAKKHLLDTAAAPETLLTNAPLPALQEKPPAPVKCKIIVQDITSQKLVRHAADRPRGLLCYLDEMASWVDKICDSRSGDDRSAWTVAYESNRYEMDRVGAGTITADNYSVSFFGNIQPRVFRSNFKELTKDGLIQRFIPVALRPEYTHLGNPVPECLTNSAAYDQMVRVCYGLPAMTYRLSDAAYEVFREYQKWYHAMMHDERLLGSSPSMQTAMGKLVGLCARVALVWHCIESPYSIEVSKDLMVRVVKFTRSYLVPALRYTYNQEFSEVATLDRWVAEYVVQYCDQDSLTLTQITRSARRTIERIAASPSMINQLFIAAMVPLEEAKWVARMDDGREEHKGVAQWAINPSIRDQFAAHRREIVAAKVRDEQRRHDIAGVELVASRVKGHEILKMQS